MIGDNKIEASIATELSDAVLEQVDGGITLDNGIKRAAGVKELKATGNDIIFAVASKDTLLDRPGGSKTFRRG